MFDDVAAQHDIEFLPKESVGIFGDVGKEDVIHPQRLQRPYGLSVDVDADYPVRNLSHLLMQQSASLPFVEFEWSIARTYMEHRFPLACREYCEVAIHKAGLGQGLGPLIGWEIRDCGKLLHV
jgi:hypothetical protein